MRYLGLAMFAGMLSMPSSAEVSANLTFVSDYLFAGVSQTSGTPALQGGIEYAHDSGFSIGTWASTVDFKDGSSADAEVDIYIGYSGETDSFSYSATLLQYIYPDLVSGADYDYAELLLSLETKQGFSVALGYSNDEFASDEAGVRLELGYSIELADDVAVSFGLGHFDLDDVSGDSYQYFSTGISKSWDNFSGSFTIHKNSSNAETMFGKNGEDRAVLSVGYSF
ncbi:TorF family putative porin [Pleionea sp. CnH1-48]|uniref:TorF family putative porin n=1 Tax=Pleionea sp. CnH1-48 TaxID=2954494 RepID=UPI002096A3C6|nr:TorF family putative porin [Pleionea sp. CnH1-48]MCO7222939.1 TorF family putative porin [Pleionea sp. CnH1-48]